jgi:hypothetical protein
MVSPPFLSFQDADTIKDIDFLVVGQFENEKS